MTDTLPNAPAAFTANLISIETLSDEVRSFTFEAADGHAAFTLAEPGAHIDVYLPGELLRQYSLWQWDPKGRWGSVAVKREAEGRGGSAAMHDLNVGQTVSIAGPRNNFPLVEEAPYSMLLAGGIGATPIYAMAARLAALGRPQTVHYRARSRAAAAFGPAFEGLGLGSSLKAGHDDTDGLIDLPGLFAGLPKGAHFYVCGPGPLLDAALAEAARHLPAEQIHFERFSAAPGALDGPMEGFEVVLSQSGRTLQVPPEKSILEVLQDAGIPADFGCTEGVCGACIMDVLEGEIDHRDGVLTPEEQAENSMMCVCVSRAKGAKLVLDA
jgi:vanillate O-demethylase ferredoxin subunit